MTTILGDEKMKTKPTTMLLMMIAGWMNRQQQEIIEYLQAENSILIENLQKATGRKRIILNDKQRRRLAILAKRLGRKVVGRISSTSKGYILQNLHFFTRIYLRNPGINNVRRSC